MTCDAVRQQDEMFCAACGLRWEIGEGKPLCQKDPSREYKTELDDVRIRLAKAINGPHDDRWVGREKLLEMRDHKWAKTTSRAEKERCLRAVDCVLEEIKNEH